MIGSSGRYILAVALWLLVTQASGGYVHYRDTEVKGSLSTYSALFLQNHSPPIADSESFVSFNLTFTQSEAGLPYSLAVVIYNYQDLAWLFPQRPACCTAELYQAHFCSEPGRLIIAANHSYDVVTFTSSSSTPEIYQKYVPLENGIYVVQFFNCDHTPNRDVTMTGVVEWRNPYGYLSGELWGFIPFYFSAVIAYLAFLVAWCILCVIYRKGLLPLQYAIGVVVALGLLESCCHLLNYLVYNHVGEASYALIISTIIATTLKQTSSRLLLLLLGLGYSIIKYSLGDLGTKIGLIVLTLVYVTCTALALLGSSFAQVGITYFLYFSFYMVPLVSVINAIFYAWIIIAFMRTISVLRSFNQNEKLKMYMTFMKIILSLGALSVLATAIQIWLQWSPSMLLWVWPIWWTNDAYWDTLYYFILLAVAVIWRPNQRNERYGYIQMSENDGDVPLKDLGAALDAAELEQEYKADEQEDHADDIANDSQTIELLEEGDDRETRFDQPSFEAPDVNANFESNFDASFPSDNDSVVGTFEASFPVEGQSTPTTHEPTSQE